MDKMYIVIIIGFLLIVLLSYISILNKIKRTSIKVEEALSGIDVALSKRYNILSKMIDVVKGYAKHEKETMFQVIQLRKDMSLSEKAKENIKMDENMEKIDVLVENYPDLKASENFKVLQKSILEVEEHLQASRRCYNSNVSRYNQLIMIFPTNLVAKSRGMTKRDFFEASELEKKNDKIDL